MANQRFPDELEYYRHKLAGASSLQFGSVSFATLTRSTDDDDGSLPTRKKRKASDPVRTAFYFFLSETRDRLRAEGEIRSLEDLKDDAGLAWDALEDWQKEPYRQQAK